MVGYISHCWLNGWSYHRVFDQISNNIAKKWKGIELIEVEEEVEEDVEEPKTKRGDHVGFGDIIGEEGDTLALEGADEIPYHKLFKKRTE